MRQASEAQQRQIRVRCLDAGVHAVGFARAGVLGEDFEHYRRFVEAGRASEMFYLAQDVEARRRTDGPEILEGAQTIIVCALGYARTEFMQPDDARTPRVARYARGRDYHTFFRRMLRGLAAWIRREFPGERARPMVDTAPILERAWARKAGVGFVGKNGCIIVPGLGSYVLLGTIATTVRFEPGDPMPPRCGECELCLTSCPTQAFDRAFVLDPRKCISYLTIEHRTEIHPSLRAPIGANLFGCDDCQSVCPFNRTEPQSPESTRWFASNARWQNADLTEIVTWTDDAFRTATQGSPLSRSGRDGLARNAAIVMANSGDRRYLPVLRDIAASDRAPVVRDAARWAVERLAHDDASR